MCTISILSFTPDSDRGRDANGGRDPGERGLQNWKVSFDSIIVRADVITSVGDFSGAIPTRLFLHQNYPNPFNPLTVISYQLPVTSHAALKIYNVLGQEVATLVNQEMKPGIYEVTWDN